MTNVRTLQNSFAGGELSEDMYSRVEDAKHRSGAARLRNFIVRPTGTVASRPGFQFVRAVKDSTKAVRLLRFTVSSTETIVIEAGDEYFRFHKDGGTVSLASTPDAYVASSTFTPTRLGFTISAYDNATGIITSTTAHGLANDAPVYMTLGTGGVMVGSFVAGTVYYANVIDAYNFRLDDVTPYAAPITGGAAGPGTAVLVWPFNLVSGITFTSDHGLTDNDPIRFTIDSGSALPSPLAVGTTYYAEVLSSTAIRIRPAPSAAKIDLVSFGTAGGTFRVQHDYEPMDLARHSGTNYYCVQDPTINGAAQKVPGSDAAYWHALSGTIYEIPSPYAETDLFDITYDQSNDVLSMAHAGHPLGELRRYGETQWLFAEPPFTGSVVPPTSVSVAATLGINLTISAATEGGGLITLCTTNVQHRLAAGDVIRLSGLANGNPFDPVFCLDGTYMVGSAPSSTTFIPANLDGGASVAATGVYTASSGRVAYLGSDEEGTNFYVVTAVGPNGTESVASASTSVLNNLLVRSSYNTITWAASTSSGVTRYHVYKRSNGLYGLIGVVDASQTLSFRDDNVDPDLGRSPPLEDTDLDSSYPSVVAHFEQRRVLAATTADPQQVWGTRTGTESDLSYHIPVQDDDRISFAISSRESATIKHAVPVAQLLLLTASGEYRVTPVNSDAITPTSIAVRAQSYIGCTKVTPLIVNTTLLFCAARGGHVREMGYSAQADSYITGDLSIRAAHLFDGHTITDAALSKAPYPIAWFTSDDGRLLGLTYIPEEGIGAWHWHDTDGEFESVCAAPEGSEDRLYAVVLRNINGVATRTIERMGSQEAQAGLEDSFCVDCGLTYDGAAATSITGLSHLNGEAVSVLADGLVVSGKTVSGGSVTLTTAASVVHIGLPFTCDLQTLPLAVQIEAAGHGRTKNVNRVWMRCVDSGAFQVGPNSTLLRSSDPRGDNAGTFVTGQVMVPIDGKWTDDGQVWLRQSDPLPVTVVGQVLEVSIGG